MNNGKVLKAHISIFMACLIWGLMSPIGKDAMLGDSTLYARSDALEASWRIIDPILQHWQDEGEKNLFNYEPGENGPEEKSRLEMPEVCYGCKIHND